MLVSPTSKFQQVADLANEFYKDFPLATDKILRIRRSVLLMLQGDMSPQIVEDYIYAVVANLPTTRDLEMANRLVTI